MNLSIGTWILLALLAICLGLAYAYRAKLIAFFVRCQVFFREVKAEMRKVTWPSKDEVVSSTVLVLVAVVFLAIVIGIEDAILAKVVQFVFVR